MSEHDEQCAVVEYLELLGVPYYAIPNDGKRSPQTAAWLRRQGMSKGVPDLCVPVARGQYHSLYIEMKAPGGKPTKEQAEWVWRLREEGMCAYVCVGAESAIALVERYMALSRDGSV